MTSQRVFATSSRAIDITDRTHHGTPARCSWLPSARTQRGDLVLARTGRTLSEGQMRMFKSTRSKVLVIVSDVEQDGQESRSNLPSCVGHCRRHVYPRIRMNRARTNDRFNCSPVIAYGVESTNSHAARDGSEHYQARPSAIRVRSHKPFDGTGAPSFKRRHPCQTLRCPAMHCSSNPCRHQIFSWAPTVEAAETPGLHPHRHRPLE
jgi:hypothetical protein